MGSSHLDPPFESKAGSSWVRLGGFRGRGSPFPAGSRKVQDRFHLHPRGARRFGFLHDRPGNLHLMADLEIQHLLISLKAEHQRRPRRKWRRSRYRWPLATSPVRNEEFPVRDFATQPIETKLSPRSIDLG